MDRNGGFNCPVGPGPGGDARNRDNKQLTDYLDGLGLQRSAGVGIYHSRFACAAGTASKKVMEGLATYADIVRRPMLPESGFESARDLALQALAGIDDEQRLKLMIKLREWHFASPFGRNSMGEKDHLEKADAGFVQGGFWLPAAITPAGSILMRCRQGGFFDELRRGGREIFW